ncbi:MAG: hypothetical protein JXA78_01205 [Anaerolineales bacterium]|nr:hypothetical protein [Anaerolineales bacterium]
MADSFSDLFLSLLNVAPLSRIRRNHGLEHATLHVLADGKPRRPLAGHSDLSGFWIIGEVSAEELQAAAGEALRRLQNGEHELAVHPNCGTNIAASGLLAGVAAALGMFGAGRSLRDKLERLPLAVGMATLALILAQPLGLLLQERVTTSGAPLSLEIVEISSNERGRFKAHRVITQG